MNPTFDSLVVVALARLVAKQCGEDLDDDYEGEEADQHLKTTAAEVAAKDFVQSMIRVLGKDCFTEASIKLIETRLAGYIDDLC